MSKNGSTRPRRSGNGKDGGNRIRVRGKRLDQIDNTKLALAYWLLAKRLVEDKTEPRLPTEDEVRRASNKLDDDAGVGHDSDQPRKEAA